MLKRLSLAALAALAFAAPASAQDKWVEIDDAVQVPMLGMSADAVEDMDVMGPGGSKVGEVEEVVGTAAGAPSALVVDFEDETNYADRDVVIPLDQFMVANNAVMLHAGPDDVAKYPVWDD